jgi:hypothetical protein
VRFTWSNFKRAKSARTIGSTLSVNLPLFGIESINAKVDTGAFSGALHATNIHQTKSGRKLRFDPFGSQDHTIEVEKFHKRKVRSSNGQSAFRYAVDTEIEFRGKKYPITVTLTNREKMKYPMLIGRSFLRLHGFLIDVNNKSE